MSVFIVERSLQLAVGNLADSERDGLFLERLVREFGLDGQLTRAVRDHIDKQLAAVNILKKFRHCGVKH